MKNLLLVNSSLLLVTLAGCGGNGSSDNNDDGAGDPPPPPPAQATFEVSMTNLTNAQPLSPVAVVAHDGQFRIFQIGAPASTGLELLAEGGDNSDLLMEADASAGVISSISGQDPIGPGASGTVTVTVDESAASSLSLSIATMLVNTNDAFSGANSIDVSGLMVGESLRRRAIAYDAGTEADTEAAGTMPGPADGGEGFNAQRDDNADRVSMHAGVVSNEAGLATSVLSSQQRFDNPVLEFSVTRIE